MLTPEREALFGGAAGGGKSNALLMAALQYADVPGYAAILFRRTYADLSLPGALMDRAHEWLNGTDAHWSEQTKTWAFPSGATLSFGYLEGESDKLRYQSAEFQFCGFDELTQFSESQYRYLFSRLRRLKSASVPLRMRAASNPGGPGHEWVKQRFVTSKRGPERVFIPARLADNPYLDRDEYAKSLAEVDILTRAQLLDGNWDAKTEGVIAKREWFPIVSVAPASGKRVRFWDLAATEESAKRNNDPDYTVGTRMVKTDDNTYCVEHIVRGRYGPGAVKALMLQTAQSDGPSCRVLFEQEGGSSGKIVADDIIKLLAGFQVKGIPSTGDKVQRAMPFIAQAEAGNVRLAAGPWCSDWLDEITSVPQGAHDDQWDSAAGAFNALVPPRGVLLA